VEQTQTQPKKIHRWIFLVVIVLNILAAGAVAPVMPHIQLPAEKLTHEPIIGNVYLTNTIVAVLIADILLLLIAWSIRRQAKQGKEVFTGIAGVFSVILEYLYGLTESTARKWAKKIFPWFATIMLLVLVVNWMELIPGVDSIGILEKSDHGFPTKEVLPGIVTIVKPETDASESHSTDEEHGEEGYALIPFVRVSSTDLNFTLGLALTSVVMIQVIGFQALGFGYLTKYFPTHAVKNLVRAFRKPGMGGPFDLMMPLIEIIVGMLEIVAEISKVVSFTFRLFGNIFAGAVLLFVIGSIFPVFFQTIFLFLELGVGAVQAFVFGILTMVFMSMATHGHGDHSEAH
jgi:F-type H+-transporting ATPase subunit a